MARSIFFFQILLLLGLIISRVYSQTAVVPSTGDGSVNNPYHIMTLGNLYWIAEDSSRWSKNYIQTADINAVETKVWFRNSGWVPIGNLSNGFTGTYDGKLYRIDNLYIRRHNENAIGFFGRFCGKAINIVLTNVNVLGSEWVGGLAAENDGTINNCFCDGVITGSSNSGVLVGFNHYGLIINCSSTGNTIGWEAGGLVGVNSGTINNCFSTSTVKSHNSDGSGGLVGWNYHGTINNCYSTGNISGDSCIGGLVGKSNFDTISNCYSTGRVSGSYYVGGLVGQKDSSGSQVTNSFWDIQSSGMNISASGTGKTTAEMKSSFTFIQAGWDFMDETVNGTNNIWGINQSDNSGYPFLKWQGYLNNQTPILTKMHHYTYTDSTIKRMFLYSAKNDIRLVKLNGAIVRKAKIVNGNQCLSKMELPGGVFIAQSGSDLLRIIKVK